MRAGVVVQVKTGALWVDGDSGDFEHCVSGVPAHLTLAYLGLTILCMCHTSAHLRPLSCICAQQINKLVSRAFRNLKADEVLNFSVAVTVMRVQRKWRARMRAAKMKRKKEVGVFACVCACVAGGGDGRGRRELLRLPLVH